MEEYGQVFGEDFGADFFSQEYWYLFIVALARHWRGAPLHVGEACRTMKTGSPKTRETRLKRLLDEGWFRKGKHDADLRKTYVLPTPLLLRVGRRHLVSSLLHVTRRLAEGELLPAQLEPELQRQLHCPADAPPPQLMGWAEFLIGYTDDWNATFDNRFHTEEYWYPFVHCLRGHWAGAPLTVTRACEVMRTGSHRTRETRIAIAEGRGMLTKRRSESDLRSTLILPTPALEAALVGHFRRTLGQLASLLR